MFRLWNDFVLKRLACSPTDAPALFSSCVSTISLTASRAGTRSRATAELLNAGSGSTELNKKPKCIPCCSASVTISAQTGGKKASRFSCFYERAADLHLLRRNEWIYRFVHGDHGIKTGGGREIQHSSRMWLVPYTRGSVVHNASVCLYVSARLFGVHAVRNPPANERALCGVRPYCLLRAGPFVTYC